MVHPTFFNCDAQYQIDPVNPKVVIKLAPAIDIKGGYAQPTDPNVFVDYDFWLSMDYDAEPKPKYENCNADWDNL